LNGVKGENREMLPGRESLENGGKTPVWGGRAPNEVRKAIEKK